MESVRLPSTCKDPEMSQAHACRMHRILSADGADALAMARLYLAVVQAKLLFGSETWVLSERALGRLERFHARCARYIARRHIRKLPDGTWLCPPTNEVLDQCGLSPIATYIAKRKTTLLNNYAIPSSSLYRQCITSTPVGSGARRQMWRHQRRHQRSGEVVCVIHAAD